MLTSPGPSSSTKNLHITVCFCAIFVGHGRLPHRSLAVQVVGACLLLDRQKDANPPQDSTLLATLSAWLHHRGWTPSPCATFFGFQPHRRVSRRCAGACGRGMFDELRSVVHVDKEAWCEDRWVCSNVFREDAICFDIAKDDSILCWGKSKTSGDQSPGIRIEAALERMTEHHLAAQSEGCVQRCRSAQL